MTILMDVVVIVIVDFVEGNICSFSRSRGGDTSNPKLLQLDFLLLHSSVTSLGHSSSRVFQVPNSKGSNYLLWSWLEIRTLWKGFSSLDINNPRLCPAAALPLLLPSLPIPPSLIPSSIYQRNSVQAAIPGHL